MKIWSRTKIVATLGPASDSKNVIQKLVENGADVLRLNFSHGSFDEHANRIRMVRQAAREMNYPVALLADLPGPKLRVGKWPAGQLTVKAGDHITLSSRPRDVAPTTIPIAYPYLAKDLKPKHTVFIADGHIRLIVESIRNSLVHCRVTNGGVIKPGNGVNMPMSSLTAKPFTPADQRALAFNMEMNIDFAGLSFIESGNDIDRIRAFAARKGRAPFLIAKIERQQALKNLKDILNKADGVMVARGDLGVEVPYAELPGIQQEIVSEARRRGKPVIVATQVLESMLQNPRPTRAEAVDIANAVWGGADALMLSGETSIGKYPVESVQALSSVIGATERRLRVADLHEEAVAGGLWETIAMEAARIAEKVKAKILVIPTITGATAMRVSRFRPSIPILAFVNDASLRRRLNLFWGIKTLNTDKTILHNSMAAMARSYLLKNNVVKRGDSVLILSGAWGKGSSEKGKIQIISA